MDDIEQSKTVARAISSAGEPPIGLLTNQDSSKTRLQIRMPRPCGWTPEKTKKEEGGGRYEKETRKGGGCVTSRDSPIIPF